MLDHKIIVKFVNIRDQLYKKYKKSLINLTLKEKYINYRNILNRLIRNRKINDFKEIINKNRNDSKTLWNTVKSIHSKTTNVKIK